MTAELVELVPKLTIVGFSNKGAYIPLGSMPLENPEERYETINSIFDEIDRCDKEEVLCRVGSVSFYPAAFDFFSVS